MSNKKVSETKIVKALFLINPNIAAEAIQTMKNRKQKKKKKNSKVDISERNKHKCEYSTIDTPYKDNSGGKKLSYD